MYCLHMELFVIGTFLASVQIVVAKDYYGSKGSDITLTCPFKNQSVASQWEYSYDNLSSSIYSINAVINDQLPQELSTRLSVTGNYAIGEYNLQIRNIRETDEGRYKCVVGLQVDHQGLYLIVPPSSVSIENVTSMNRLLGTEGQDMMVSCVAVGGKPPPNVTLNMDGSSLATGNQSVKLTLRSISRSYDRKTVTCLSSNDANVKNPNSNSAMFYLNLKPLQPIFSSDPVSTEETKPLVVSCTSTGSRPPASLQWTIGLENVTSNFTTQSAVNTDDTYTVTSVLTYSVNRTYNEQTVTCGAYNTVSTNGVVTSSRLDVKFAPKITVDNVTYYENITTKTVTCTPVGNPTTYSYSRWQHKSKYGVLLRELVGGSDGVLTLPYVSVEARYQDSGQYICTADNGIKGRNGEIPQSGSGYVSVNAQPTFTYGNNEIKSGEFGKDVDIHVYVYSVPKYSSFKWYKSNTEMSQTNNYNFSVSGDIVYDIFNGTKVQLDGYRFTLTIKKLGQWDLNVSYRVEVSNGVGPFVGYTVLLVSESAPETPINFTALNPSESSIVVQWEAGYNGGHDQTFNVEYRVLGSVIWMAKTIPATKQTGRQTYTLTGLLDGTLYELRMFAENILNKSLPTETEEVKTIKGSQSPIQIGPIVGGVAGGLLAALIIIAIIWFVVLRRKKDTSTNSKAPRSKSDSEVSDGLQHNILYQSAGSDFKPLVPKAESGKTNQKPSTSETEYAEVQKPNAMYAAVDKTQQKNVEDKKQKDKKKRPNKLDKKADKAGNNNKDDEYANAGMSLKDMVEGNYANAEDRKGPPTNHKNQQGLEYADLSFTKQIPQKGKKPVIHGGEDRTLYSEVDHTKKAPPPPQESAYEETNFKHG